jgi:hypothetical protein
VGTNAPTVKLDINGVAKPFTNNAFTLGSASFGWSNIYSQNALTVLSDARTKTDIENSTLGLGFINSLRAVSYKFLVGGNAVTQVDDGIEEVEVTPARANPDGGVFPAVTMRRGKVRDVVTPVAGTRTHHGLLSHEVKAAVDATGVDFAGWVLSDKDDPDSLQLLRYEQFIAPLIKSVQELSGQVGALKLSGTAQQSLIVLQQTALDALVARVVALETSHG